MGVVLAALKAYAIIASALALLCFALGGAQLGLVLWSGRGLKSGLEKLSHQLWAVDVRRTAADLFFHGLRALLSAGLALAAVCAMRWVG